MGCIVDCNVGMTFATSGNFEENNELPYANTVIMNYIEIAKMFIKVVFRTCRYRQ